MPDFKNTIKYKIDVETQNKERELMKMKSYTLTEKMK